MMRWINWSTVISNEKIPTGSRLSKQKFSTMLRAKAVFPIAGRAARMIKLEGLNPLIILSRSKK
ncbi:Uncharacterised protein [Chlamydia trachomatis]|nr:Uncharacterised protein [Chlamydia trachomatis]CRI74585.1 Uncharacterised protein [Chlamydia trachomatis]